MKELKGSEKQIKWAEDIRQGMFKELEEKEKIYDFLQWVEEENKKAGKWNDEIKKTIRYF